MVETLKKLREPAALVLLAALALRLLMGLVSVFVLATNDRLDSFAAAARIVSQWATDSFTLVVLGGLVASCVLVDRTPRARQLTVYALVVVAASIGLTFVFGLIGLGAPGGINRGATFVVFLTDLVIPVLVAVVLFRMLQQQPAPARPQALTAGPYPQAQQGHAPGQYGAPGQGGGHPQQDPNRPTWQPDEAAGAAWNTAGDAASGAAASGWGTPGESGGWSPNGPQATGPIPGLPYSTEETQQIYPGQPYPGQPYPGQSYPGQAAPQSYPAQPPTPWGAAPFDRTQPSPPSSAASAPADNHSGERGSTDGGPEFGRSGETGPDQSAESSAQRQDNDWWNTRRP